MSDMRSMTLWQFGEVKDGWMAANAPEQDGMSAEEADAAWEAVKAL